MIFIDVYVSKYIVKEKSTHVIHPVISPFPSTIRYQTPLKFAGKDNPAADILKAKGVTAEVLKKEWGVILWRSEYSPKHSETKLRVDTRDVPDFDENKETQFLTWLKDKVGDALGEIKLKLKPHNQCCRNHCNGCLKGNGDKLKDEWIG